MFSLFKKNILAVPFLVLFTLPFLIAIGLLTGFANKEIVLKNQAAEPEAKALSRDNLPWKIYPKAQMRINGKTYSNDSKLTFKKGEIISFDADLSVQDYRLEVSPDGKLKQNIKSYFWSFGDWNNEKGQKVSHSYSQDGIYPVSLSVEHENGNLDSTSLMIKIGTSKESEIYRGEDFEKYFQMHPGMKAEAEKLTGKISVSKKAKRVRPSPPLDNQLDKVAILVDSDTYGALNLNQYLIEGKNPIDRYIEDVQTNFPEVRLILVNDKNWESWDPVNCSPQPTCRPEYDIRNTLRNLYHGTDSRITDGEGIKGAVLIGLLPYFRWYQQLFGESGYNNTVCSQCYEDLDGLYEDRYKMGWDGEVSCPSGQYCDGYMDYVDYQPTGTENNGPEIWVSWIRPLVDLPNSDETQQLKDFFLKNHNYYRGEESFLNRPLLVFNNSSEQMMDSIKGSLFSYYKNNIDIVGGIQTPILSKEEWFNQETSHHKYLYVNTHGSPWSITFAFNSVDMNDMLNLTGRSLVSVFHSCATANFNLTSRENFQLSAIGSSQIGLNSEGNGVMTNWLTNGEEIIPAWISGVYYGKAWFEGKKSFLLREWLQEHRNLPSFLLFGNPFVRFSFQPDFVPTLVPTSIPTLAPVPPVVCNPYKPSCKPGFSCKCSVRGPEEGSKGGCFCSKT